MVSQFKALNTLGLKECLQKYLHLSSFKNISKARMRNHSNSRHVFLSLDQSIVGFQINNREILIFEILFVLK
jgi:hypothetical protein